MIVLPPGEPEDVLQLSALRPSRPEDYGRSHRTARAFAWLNQVGYRMIFRIGWLLGKICELVVEEESVHHVQ